jgi:hypothetical protein
MLIFITSDLTLVRIIVTTYVNDLIVLKCKKFWFLAIKLTSF